MDDETTGRGRIGHEIFEQVEQLVSSEGLSRTQAFQRISEQTGRRAGTVAANYYRVARQRGATLQPRSGRGRARTSASQLQAAITKVQNALGELNELVQRQDEEITQLRRDVEDYQRLRDLVSKSI